MIFPRPCPACGVLTEEDGFPRERSQPQAASLAASAAASAFYRDVRKTRLQAVEKRESEG
jgi:hypothetical protein